MMCCWDVQMCRCWDLSEVVMAPVRAKLGDIPGLGHHGPFPVICVGTEERC